MAKGSAAEQAGVAVADVITAIDGKPSREDDLSDTRRRLRAEPAGTTIDLTIRRGAARRSVLLTLKDQI